jgi:hypothetical protein
LKLDYWQKALVELGDLVDIVTYADDFGTQESQIISPDMFRRLIKPRVKILFETLIKSAPHAKRFFHSDGNVRPLISDFIEMGVEILNPIHIRAKVMEPAGLKRDFGRDLAFWGGGVESYHTARPGKSKTTSDAISRLWRPAADTYSILFTISRPMYRPKTSSPCGKPFRNTAYISLKINSCLTAELSSATYPCPLERLSITV